MFVSPPDPYLVPDYKISPFRTTDIARNRHLPLADSANKYFRSRHPGYELRYTANGRDALWLALAQINLQKEDVVTIVTTTQNRYISSCVTGEVEKFCAWNRIPDSRTRAIIIVHEFGIVCSHLDKYRVFGVPIIEDCAYSFFSGDEVGLSGHTGDFVVYSFPKMFPIQEGGLLASQVRLTNERKPLRDDALQYYQNVLSFYLAEDTRIIAQRRTNHAYLAEKFAQRGFAARFTLTDTEVPGVFMFQCNTLDLDRLKEHMTCHGIQCSVFYGETAFFIPVHQAMTADDLDYVVFVFDRFANNAKS